MNKPREIFLDLGPGRRVHCLELGSGPDVVYFPGNYCSCEDMQLLWERIAHKYRFIGIDPPGCEPTEWPDEPFNFLTDLPKVIDRVLMELQVKSHVALGHSMGGMYALQHANRHRNQVKALVLFEGFVTLKIHHENAAPDGFRPFRMAPTVEKAFRRRLAANQNWVDSHPRFKATFFPSQQAHDARPWVAELNIPILVFIGENGQTFPTDLEGWRKQLGMDGVKSLTVAVIPNSGHWMMLDDPDRVWWILGPFLDMAHGHHA